MPGLVSGIHDFSVLKLDENVDGRAFARRSDGW
jgi:hypothetical protein